jgi:hypothetical protein
MSVSTRSGVTAAAAGLVVPVLSAEVPVSPFAVLRTRKWYVVPAVNPVTVTLCCVVSVESTAVVLP